MKIAILLTSLNVGGAEMQVYRILTRLKDTSIDPIVISMRTPKEVGGLIETLGIPVYSLDMESPVQYARGAIKLHKILRSWKPEVLSTFLYHANILGRFVGRAAGVPKIVSSIRNIHFGGKGREWMVKRTDFMVDLSVVNSRIAADRMIRDGLLRSEKTTVILNGIDSSPFKVLTAETRREARRAWSLSETDFLWIAVGRFDPQKNYFGMLESFLKVVQKQPEARLFLVGDGPLKPACEAFVRENGLGKQVSFLGLRHDVPSLLGIADAYLMASLWEGLPNVIMEAACASLPIVATEVGGVGELVFHEKNGFLVSDPGKLNSAMLDLMMLSQEERQVMGERSRIHLVENFSIEAIADQWKSFYESIGG